MLTRRDLLGASMLLPFIGTACAQLSSAARTMTLEDLTKPTRYVDFDRKDVRAASMSAVGRATGPRDRALAIFEFVRNIPFGFSAGFWDNKASDVLRSRRGYCNTKSTLFVAMLRSVGVPARQQFVEIDARILHGILDPGTTMVDHSYVEVLLDGEWIATDAYIVDPPLFAVARDRLRRENRLLGYGAHATGSNEWDGQSPSFSQYNMLDARPIGVKKWGVFADIGDFYARADGTHNRLNPILRAGIGLLTASANGRAEKLRASFQSAS